MNSKDLLLLYAAKVFGGSKGPTYLTTASDYDGTNDYALRGANLTGAADGKVYTLAFWLNLDADGSNETIFQTEQLAIQVLKQSVNRILVTQYESGAGLLTQVFGSTNTLNAADGWVWVGIAFNTDATTYIYHGDTQIATKTLAGQTMAMTATNWAIGAINSGGGVRLNGCLSEFWYAQEYVDFSVEANRRKFISNSGKPVSLGEDGSAPTGTQPLIYAPDGDPSTNLGSGGDFTITGALTECASSPSG